MHRRLLAAVFWQTEACGGCFGELVLSTVMTLSHGKIYLSCRADETKTKIIVRVRKRLHELAAVEDGF